MRYDHKGYHDPSRAQKLYDEQKAAERNVAEAERAQFSADFARLCGILSSTGIGRSV